MGGDAVSGEGGSNTLMGVIGTRVGDISFNLHDNLLYVIYVESP